MERLVEQKSAVNMFFNDSDDSHGVEQFTQHDWKFMDNLVNVLQPIESATAFLSGSKYCALSLLTPLLTAMFVNLKILTNMDLQSKAIRDELLKSFNTRFADTEKNEYCFIASLLDPRIKATCFRSTEHKNKAIRKLKDLVRALPKIQEKKTR
jgi:hypothetical protein